MTLEPRWQRWVVENLLAGASVERVAARLVESGVSPAVASREIEALRGSPAFAGAAAVATRARAAEQVLRLGRTLGRGLVIEERAGVDADTFYGTYVAAGLPVKLPDFAASWPAVGRWDLDYLDAVVGDAPLSITDGRDDDPDYDMNSAARSRPTTMREVTARIRALDGRQSNDFYAVAQNRNLARPELAPLFDDMNLSSGLLDPERCRTASALWLGPAGTVTPLHHDTSGIVFVQVWGRKRLLLASPTETALLRGARAMYAAVDPEGALEGDLGEIRFHDVELDPGQSLFIPAGWWHHVRALTPSISVALNGMTRLGNAYDWYCPGRA